MEPFEACEVAIRQIEQIKEECHREFQKVIEAIDEAIRAMEAVRDSL